MLVRSCQYIPNGNESCNGGVKLCEWSTLLVYLVSQESSSLKLVLLSSFPFSLFLVLSSNTNYR